MTSAEEKEFMKKTKDVLSCYRAMAFVVKQMEEDCMFVSNRASDLSSPRMDCMPHIRNVHSYEDRLVEEYCCMETQIERYMRARHYFDIVNPILNDLPALDRKLIEMFYIDDDKANTIFRICDELHLERSAAYKRVERAAKKVCMRLYGCNPMASAGDKMNSATSE